MFPNSPNTTLTLLTIKSEKDSIGTKRNVIKTSKTIVGSKKSITRSEHQTSTSLGINIDLKVVVQSILYDNSKFVKIDDELYKIERTFENGQFLELYLSKSDIEVSNVWIHQQSWY